MRAFVAVDVTDSGVVDSVKKFQSELDIDARPTVPENLHFTLQFLGDVPEEGITDITDALKKVRFEPFDVRLSGIGAFPEYGPPRIVWIGADDGGRLSALAKDIGVELGPLGFCPDNPFRPHLTVFRVKKKAGNTREKLDATAGFGVQRVERFKLKSSSPGAGGFTYSDLWESS